VWDDAGGPEVGAVLRVALGTLEAAGVLGASGVAQDGGRVHPAERPTAEEALVFPEGLVRGSSPAMLALYEQMRVLVQGDLPVLLEGETGVGKEHLARVLHLSSPRRRGPFVAVNCAAIPADLLEAELFGIAKGVATGVSERPGRFQLARGGMLLLDEIGEMPPALQAKLLRVLQEKEVQPVGGAPVPTDLRVVSATNSDLRLRVEEGRFRRDLYFRVAGYVLRVPPLRERREDIPGLVRAFVDKFAAEAAKSLRGVSVRALAILSEYAWPGNVRELEHELRRLVYLCPEGQAIDSPMLSPHLLERGLRPVEEPGSGESTTTPGPVALTPESDAAGSLDLEAELTRVESRLIQEALTRSGGNLSRAARLLGTSRNGLAIKMTRLGLKR